jgi:transcriptional regulator with XRE-family HTH domain
MNNLKKIRKDRGFTQEYLSKILDVSESTYSRYESKLRKLDADVLTRLSSFYNLSIDYILGNIDEPVTLDELRFLKDLKEKSNEQLISEHDFIDDDGKKMSRKDIKKMLEILRAYED